MKFYRLIVSMISTLMTVCIASAQIRDVRGTFTYVAEPDESRIEAAAKAMHQARIEALSHEFGTIVSQDVRQSETKIDDRESVLFFASNESQVRGEWIGDMADPKYEYGIDSQGNMMVTCTVSGRAKPISNESADFTATLLRNGTTSRFQDTRFRPNDKMYMSFSAPEDGFVAVFLEDQEQNVYTLLPYVGSNGMAKIRKDYEYVFFDEKRQCDFGPVRELIVTLDGERELNKIYVVFSPNRFGRPTDKATPNRGGLPMPRMQTWREFNDWLLTNRHRDPRMAVRSMNIEITNQ